MCLGIKVSRDEVGWRELTVKKAASSMVTEDHTMTFQEETAPGDITVDEEATVPFWRQWWC